MKMNKFIELIKERLSQRDNEGAGLVSILGVSMIVLIVAGSVTASAAISTTFTYSQLSSQQATDYAEAGLTDAIAKYESGVCQNSASNENSSYSYSVYRSSSSVEPPTNVNDPQTKPGCPQPEDNWLIVKSVGKGINNAESTKTGIYKIVGKDENILPHAITTSTLDTKTIETLQTANGLSSNQPSILLNGTSAFRHTFLICDKNNSIDATVNINNQGLRSVDNCTINGNVKIKAALSPKTTVDINGNLCTQDVLYAVPKVKGTITRNDPNCSIVGSKYGYVPKAESITTLRSTENACRSWDGFASYMKNLEKTQDHIIDVRGCNLYRILNTTASETLEISTNITLLTNDITMNTLNINSKADKDVSFNFVTPSTTSSPNNSTNTTALCGADNNVTELNYGTGVHGIIYTPCSITINNSSITGQIYAGNKVKLDQTSLTYMPTEFTDPVDTIQDSKTSLVRVR